MNELRPGEGLVRDHIIHLLHNSAITVTASNHWVPCLATLRGEPAEGYVYAFEKSAHEM